MDSGLYSIQNSDFRDFDCKLQSNCQSSDIDKTKSIDSVSCSSGIPFKRSLLDLSNNKLVSRPQYYIINHCDTQKP